MLSRHGYWKLETAHSSSKAADRRGYRILDCNDQQRCIIHPYVAHSHQQHERCNTLTRASLISSAKRTLSSTAQPQRHAAAQVAAAWRSAKWPPHAAHPDTAISDRRLPAARRQNWQISSTHSAGRRAQLQGRRRRHRRRQRAGPPHPAHEPLNRRLQRLRPIWCGKAARPSGFQSGAHHVISLEDCARTCRRTAPHSTMSLYLGRCSADLVRRLKGGMD